MSLHPTEYKLNWSPSLPDPRDHLAKDKLKLAAPPPPTSDLRPLCPPIYDQGQLGSCVWNALAGDVRFDMDRQHSAIFAGTPSRLFGYYNTRVAEGDPEADSGCFVRDAMKSLNQLGVCAESLWPYIESRYARRPGKTCYRAALRERSVAYARLDNTKPVEVKQALAVGYPVIFGISVFDSFLSDAVAATGIVPLPDLATEQMQGGHAMLLIGHDDAVGVYYFRNSWGTAWGNDGYGTIPQTYLSNPDLADDFWVLTLVQ